MSTRRARIKAVAALPPRRKNAENAESTKNKPVPFKDATEKTPKSPRTARNNIVRNSEERGSPTMRSPPPVPLLLSPPPRTPTPTEYVLSPRFNTPKLSEKVSVITTVNTKASEDVFATPLITSSPRRQIDKQSVLSPKPLQNSDEVQNMSVEVSEQSSASHTVKESTLNKKVDGEKDLSSDTEDKVACSKNKDITDTEYNVPSVPDSLTEESVVDGSTPHLTDHGPKSLDSSRNETYSNNAEVQFDPIAPLPSPSKVRPKLRPVPRLAPYRRNSIQGSASESEDESRRALLNSAPTPAPPRQRHDSHTSHSTMHFIPNREVNRVRNDSVCSGVSQVTAQPPVASSPVKEKHLSKARRQEMGKRLWRRRRETVKRDALTMYDLIFYNPTTNPIVPDQDELKAKEENAKDEAERSAKIQEKETEEDVDDPPEVAPAPVPQIKLGPNGEIILDEKSLVIKQSDACRKVSSVVREGAWGGSNGGRYTRTARTAEWSPAETVRFYRALAAVGTDFSLMAQLFPDRNRRDLKLKFKKEERLNGAQVDKALRSATSWDVERLEDDFKQERKDAAARAEKERMKLLEKKKEERERIKASRDMRLRMSRGAKALENFAERDVMNTEPTVDDFIRRALKTRAALRKNNIPASHELASTEPPQGVAPPNPQFATLTLLNKGQEQSQNKSAANEMATISRVNQKSVQQINVPPNIETGSLVVLRVNDPSDSSKTMLQTYIAHGDGKLTPVALPPNFLNSVVGYMKIGNAKSTVTTLPAHIGHFAQSRESAPQDQSPSIPNQDGISNTSSVIQMTPNPAKRQRHSSYTITPL